MMRILITAGPTRESIDDVRYLSNGSSGRMGYALAAAARDAGHSVDLVSGPTALPYPAGVDVFPVESSEQMLAACRRLFPHCDGVIGAAAVCDYRPRTHHPGKIRKTGRPLILELIETTDILQELGANKGPRWVVGFALEAELARENAVRKLREKHCDAICLNAPTAIGADENTIELIDAAGLTVSTCSGSKDDIARWLMGWIESNLRGGANCKT